MSLPNSLTILRIFLTPLFVVLLVSDSSLQRQFSVVVFVTAALTDWYDGWIARKYGTMSRWGKFLDPLADKILSSSALFTFVALGLIDAWMVWIIVSRDVVITALRSYGEWTDHAIVTSKSAQAKTFGEFIVIWYILLLHVARSVPLIRYEFSGTLGVLMDAQVLFGMMLLVTISSVATGIMYCVDNRHFLSDLYASASAPFRSR
ncbi:MAG TPA: CDP-diacylglycerol--glycerol-3-phosphate 3-phosphatidyltransferase [Bacteroidota bacterium]|nr:CDP-diacylglycerol--glycerol-3-phosphate 3-phosphatidyltransferase [Bacteroidota bacterium]